jgi:hypothetical protein
MGRFIPSKLNLSYLAGTTPDKFILPRRYTLTHSDISGELFLTIGSQYNTKNISRLYTRLMRDEVLAELAGNGESLEFRVYCHVSGGFVIGTAKWRYNIFRSELPLALAAIRYGDRFLFEKNPELDNARVYVHFRSSDSKYNNVEQWGVMADYVN